MPLIVFDTREDELTDERRLVQRAGLVLPSAVWVLGLVSPPPGGLTLGYVTTYTLLLAATALVDQTAPPVIAARWRRFSWLLMEIVLCGLVVRAQGSLVRPALIYLLPVVPLVVRERHEEQVAKLSAAEWLELQAQVQRTTEQQCSAFAPDRTPEHLYAVRAIAGCAVRGANSRQAHMGGRMQSSGLSALLAGSSSDDPTPQASALPARAFFNLTRSGPSSAVGRATTWQAP